MTLSELKAALLQLTSLYFPGATVTFTKQSFAVKPSKPLVTLTIGSVSRPMNPPTKLIDGRPVSFYPCTVNVQIDLFTQGRQVSKSGYMPIMEDTAEDDMLSFVDFLNSSYVVNWCHEKDVAIIIPTTVKNLSALINDTNYEYRAMVEITVGFTMESIGYTGSLDAASVKHGTVDDEGNITITDPVDPGAGTQDDDVVEIDPVVKETPSGGGNPELVDNETGYFSNVEINDKLVKEENDE